MAAAVAVVGAPAAGMERGWFASSSCWSVVWLCLVEAAAEADVALVSFMVYAVADAWGTAPTNELSWSVVFKSVVVTRRDCGVCARLRGVLGRLASKGS